MRLLFFFLSLCFVFSVNGQFNNSLHFDGLNDYVNLNPIVSDFVGNQTYTIEFWINASSIQNETYASFFAINTVSGDLNKLVIRVSGPVDGGINNSVAINIPIGQTNNVICGSINVLDDECHHVAYTYNNGINKLYIDGILQGTLNKSYVVQSNNRISLGQEFDAPMSVLSQLYKGTLDDLRIWSTVKTNAEILANMNNELLGSELGLQRYFNFNQGAAGANNSGQTNLFNNTGNNGNGTLINFSLSGLMSNFVEINCCDFYNDYENQTNQPFSLNTIIQNESCSNSDGSITVNVPIIPNDYTFYWPSLVINGNTVQNLPSGNYNLTIMSANGCSIDTTFEVINNDVSNVPPIDSVTYCQDGVANPINLSSDPGGTIYFFDDVNQTNTFLQPITPVTNIPITYYLYYAQEINGCMSEIDSIKVIIISKPSVWAGNDTIICEGNTVQLQAVGNATSYSWNNGGTQGGIISPQISTYFVVTGLVGASCESRDSLYIEIFPDFDVNIGTDTSLCIGESLFLQLDTSYTSILWQDGSNSNSFLVTSAGDYWVQVTEGCTKIDSITIEYPSLLNIILPNDTILCYDTKAFFEIAEGDYTVVWDNYFFGNNYVLNDNSQLQLTIEIQNRCETIGKVISLEYQYCDCDVYVPNAFTPNGDELNNVFKTVSTCSYPLFDIKIFNRWGQVVFESSDLNEYWDGTFHGELCPDGEYNWLMKYKTQGENSEILFKKGHVNLLK